MGDARDIVVVGGGPSGSTTAIAFAAAAPELARRVVVLERARYPRDKPCAGALGARGDAVLARLGVTIDVPSVPIDGMALRAAGRDAVAAPGSAGRVVRRMEFDHALARAAAARGVEIREGVRVLDVVAGPAGGATVVTAGGALRARAVVGCDGVGSVVRKALGLGTGGLRAQVVEVDTEPLAGDLDRALLAFDVSDPGLAGYAWDFPTVVAGRALVSRGVYALRTGPAAAACDDGRDVGALLEARLRALGASPARGARVKRYAERGYEAGVSVARGPLMLAGEAVGIDAVTGEGIAQAIEYGALAGRFLAERARWTGARPLALDDWNVELARSRLARDLRVRMLLARPFFGPARSEVERFLTASPDVLFVGCQHFADRPYAWAKVASVAARGLLRAAVVAAAGGVRFAPDSAPAAGGLTARGG